MCWERVRVQRLHVRVKWRPEWEQGPRQWARSYIAKNLWRCDSIHSIDDLTQEAYLIYLKLFYKYPRVYEMRHFMALFKTSLRNYIHDISRVQRLKHEAIDMSSDAEDHRRIGEITHEGNLRVLCNQVPQLKAALSVYASPKLKARVRYNETVNMQLQRVTGYQNYNFRTELRKLLTQEVE